jgi:molecular chaperone GrpE (heat shock protein)
MDETKNKSSDPFPPLNTVSDIKDDSDTVPHFDEEVSEIEDIQPEDEHPGDVAVSSDSKPLEHINLSLKTFSEELIRLNSVIADRLTYDSTKEKAFDQLYADLENLKRDKEFDNLRPLFTDLILFYDRIKNIEEGLSKENSDIKSSFASTIESISTELIEILERRDIKIIHSSSSAFDPKIQKAIDVHSTNNEEMNNKVIKIVRKGFMYRDRILRPEEVIIEKFSMQSDSE